MTKSVMRDFYLENLTSRQNCMLTLRSFSIISSMLMSPFCETLLSICVSHSHSSLFFSLNTAHSFSFSLTCCLRKDSWRVESGGNYSNAGEKMTSTEFLCVSQSTWWQTSPHWHCSSWSRSCKTVMSSVLTVPFKESLKEARSSFHPATLPSSSCINEEGQEMIIWGAC